MTDDQKPNEGAKIPPDSAWQPGMPSSGDAIAVSAREVVARAMCRLHARYSADHIRSDEDVEKFIDWHFQNHLAEADAAVSAYKTIAIAASDDCRHPADAFFMDFLAKESPRLGGLSYQDQQVIVRGLKKFASQATAVSVAGAQWTADDIAKADAKAAKWHEHFHVQRGGEGVDFGGAQGGQEPAQPSAEAIIAADRIESLDVFTSDQWTERRRLTAHARSVIAFALDAFAARQVAEAVAAEREACAKWHDEQHGAWLDQARNAQRLSQSSDDADQQEYRRQHEHYAALAIIHRQSAAAIRNRK